MLHPDPAHHPTESSIVANAKEFFRFISFCIVLRVSVVEIAGRNSDLATEAIRYVLLLGAYLVGFLANYVIAYVGRLWSKGDFLSSVNGISDFYNLMFWITFMINLVFGKIDLQNPNDGAVQWQTAMTSFAVVGTVFFAVRRVKKLPLHFLTWLLVMATDFFMLAFNLFALNQVVYHTL